MLIRNVTAAVLAAATLVTVGNAFAETALASKAYQCQELRQLVADRERVYLKGFLGLKSSVYAEASSCHYLHEIPLKSAWRTSDVRSCVVGYRCISRYERVFLGND
jgi:hypothetical protein